MATTECASSWRRMHPKKMSDAVTAMAPSSTGDHAGCHCEKTANRFQVISMKMKTQLQSTRRSIPKTRPIRKACILKPRCRRIAAGPAAGRGCCGCVDRGVLEAQRTLLRQGSRPVLVPVRCGCFVRPEAIVRARRHACARWCNCCAPASLTTDGSPKPLPGVRRRSSMPDARSSRRGGFRTPDSRQRPRSTRGCL